MSSKRDIDLQCRMDWRNSNGDSQMSYYAKQIPKVGPYSVLLTWPKPGANRLAVVFLGATTDIVQLQKRYQQHHTTRRIFTSDDLAAAKEEFNVHANLI